MRMRLLALVLLALGGVFVVFSQQTNAAVTITPEMTTRIRARCVENQAALNRLHQTDAFLRTNRGELYRSISDKLMVPLNRRLASNQLDPGKLLTVTAHYNSEYTTFFNAYIAYDNALSKVLDIDCNREPVAFYNALLDAREKREALSKSNKAIQVLVREYGVEFTNFKTNYEKENQ